MTFVFAARCLDGIVVAGDTRVVVEPDSIMNGIQNKVQAIDERSIIGFAGNQYLGQRFITEMRTFAEGNPRIISELVREVEERLFNFWKEYAKARGEKEADKESEEEASLETLLVSLDEKKAGIAHAYVINPNSPPDELDDFLFVGYGAHTGRGALSVLWDDNLLIQKAWPLAVAVMKLVALRHYSVGGIPDIYLVKDKAGASQIPADEVRQVYESQQLCEALKGIPGYLLRSLKSEKKWVIL